MATPRVAEPKQRPWTFQEVQELRRLVTLNRKDSAIAKRLGRTPMAIKRKRTKLGISVHAKQGQHDSIVSRMAKKGWTDQAIADAIGRAKGQVTDIRRRLGIKAGRFTRRRADVRDNDLVQCWGCGAAAPKERNNKGWHDRPFVAGGSTHNIELYCPDCFSEHGWPEDRPLTTSALHPGEKYARPQPVRR